MKPKVFNQGQELAGRVDFSDNRSGMDEIIVVGAGGHAKACVDVLEGQGRFRIIGLIGQGEEAREKILGYQVIGRDTDLESLRDKYINAHVAVGQIKTPDSRVRLYRRLKELDYRLPIIISSLGYVSKHSRIGEGTIVMHGAVVNAGAEIGENCIINSNALVEHDAKVGAHCHIATAAIVNGGVRVGDGTFIGSGAVTKQGVSVGHRCVVGAGSVVRGDVDDNELVK